MGNDHFDVVKQIVDKIDDKHPKDCKGDSPFKVALYQSNLEMVRFLEETCGIYDEESKEGIIPGFKKSKKLRLEWVSEKFRSKTNSSLNFEAFVI